MIALLLLAIIINGALAQTKALLPIRAGIPYLIQV